MSQSSTTSFDQERIDMAVITSLEFNDQISLGISASQPHTRHSCFRAAIYYSHLLHRWHPAADKFCHLDFERIRNPKAEPVGCRFLHRFHHDLRRMPQNGRSPGSNKVDIFAPIDIPEV